MDGGEGRRGMGRGRWGVSGIMVKNEEVKYQWRWRQRQHRTVIQMRSVSGDQSWFPHSLLGETRSMSPTETERIGSSSSMDL